MRTPVRVLRGPFRGRAGTIAGNLEDRAARGITKAFVRLNEGAGDLLETANLTSDEQLGFSFPETTKDPPPARGRRRVQ